MRLVRAELRRIAARRLVRVTLALAIIGAVVGGILAFTTTGSISEATYQQRVRTAETQQRAQQATTEACLQAHGVKAGDRSPTRSPTNASRTTRSAAPDPRFHRLRLRNLLKGLSGVLAIVGWALGASLVGAEFASRSMTTFLTWETRRTRVLAARSRWCS